MPARMPGSAADEDKTIHIRGARMTFCYFERKVAKGQTLWTCQRYIM